MLLGIAPGSLGSLGYATDLPSASGSTPTFDRVFRGLYGQSLSLGSDPDGASVITTAPVTGHQMFNGAVRVLYDTPGLSNVNNLIYPSQIASLVTLQEQMCPNDVNLGETFASGIALRSTSPSITAATGRGAFRVDQLNRTAANHWPNTYTAAQAAKNLCDAAGLTMDMGPMIFKEFEADGAANTSRATIKLLMYQFAADMFNSMRTAMNGPVPRFKIIIDQQAMWATGSTFAEMAVAVAEMYRERPEWFVMAGPTYWCQFTAANDVHFTSLQYRRYGEKLGPIWQTTYDTGDCKPCYRNDTPTRSGVTIDYPVYVPTPPLVTNTTLVSAIANSGFTHTGATITNVQIVDDGTSDNQGVIRITLNTPAAGNLGFAFRNNGASGNIGPVLGARGNICDSDPFTTLYDGYAVPNWLCNDDVAVP